ncbi:SCP2 sterol-binding domain-containing protein [Desulfatibacillum aliphaticivorans]|uniref:SCP2 sterol-binding domain-containing protein n=1 Tax=Desulfatibacillum aliphaticivorans TaxID=218208 RepID=UPI00042765A7|nr:SCP2 sterol-binding domain-containing protein [Desulfatibacillum aliphaticivorans]
MNIPNNISIKELLTEYSPKMAQELLADSGKAAELDGTQFKLVVDVDGDKYSYQVTNGKEFDVQEADLDSAQARVMISKEDLEKMIATSNLDMLLGIQNDLSRAKYEALSRVKGCMVAELENDDGSKFTIRAVLNESEAPTATFKMKTTDSAALVRKETSPVTLFMGGQMKIEGDMAFAMSTQPLFT